MCTCMHSSLHELDNVGYLYNSIILHAQMNIGFYGLSVHGAPLCRWLGGIRSALVSGGNSCFM